MLRGVWACFFNDTACYSSHHFTSAHTSRWWVLDVVIANKWHVISVWWTATSDCASTSYYVSSACIDQRVSCSCDHTFSASHGNVIFVFILARYLLWSLMSALRHAGTWLAGELFAHKFSDSAVCSNKADAFFASLSVYHAHIHRRWPVLIRLRRLALTRRLFLKKFLSVCSGILWREPVVIRDFILILLHVITPSSINSLLVCLIRVITAISLLLSLLSTTYHTP